MQKTLLAAMVVLSVAAVALMVFPPTPVFAQEHHDATDSSNSDSQPLPQNVATAMGLVFFVFCTTFVISYMFLCVIVIMISVALKAVPSEYRVIEPGQIWLLLIPCFSMIWNFWVFQRVPQSFQNYFASRGRTDFGDCGGQIGIWYAITVVVGVIPFVACIAGPASFVLLIVFLVKIMSLKQQIRSDAIGQSHSA